MTELELANVLQAKRMIVTGFVLAGDGRAAMSAMHSLAVMLDDHWDTIIAALRARTTGKEQ